MCIDWCLWESIFHAFFPKGGNPYLRSIGWIANFIIKYDLPIFIYLRVSTVPESVLKKRKQVEKSAEQRQADLALSKKVRIFTRNRWLDLVQIWQMEKDR